MWLHPLAFSSLWFLTNAFHAYLKGYFLYSLEFLLLTVTSNIYHTNLTNKVYYWLDQTAVWSVVLTGFMYWTSLQYMLQLIPSISFIVTGWLFYYEKVNNVDDYIHLFLHIVSSFGHHSILFGLR